MSKKEIIEIIKEETEDMLTVYETSAYIKGFLDALCKTYEISWKEREEIETEVIEND